MTAVLCRELGIETESCPFPEYAEKLVQESAFDLVFTDIQMPGVDGFEVLRRIRAVRAELPVVAVSARSDDKGRPMSNGDLQPCCGNLSRGRNWWPCYAVSCRRRGLPRRSVFRKRMRFAGSKL